MFSINPNGEMITTSAVRTCLGVVLGLFSLLWTAAYAASPRLPLVVVSEAKAADVIKQVPLTGTITSAKRARLSTEVSGLVETLEVEVGDYVKAGAVLLRLDDEIEAHRLTAAIAATRQAEAELADARRRYEDAQRLIKQNTISKNEIQLREAEVRIDQAALQRQTAEMKRQQATVQRYRLKAPFNGVISERLTEIGEWIDPGKPVLTLVAIDELRVDFRVPQEFFTAIDDKTEVTVNLDALADKTFAGKIETVVPISDPSARTFLIHVVMPDADIKMTPGMSVHGTLRLSAGKRGLVVSRDALFRYPDGRVTVWTVNQKNDEAVVAEKRVRLGNSFNGKVSILEGIDAGDVVVVQGNESLQEGQRVRIHSRK